MPKFLIIAAAFALAWPAHAGKPIDERRPLDADGRVAVNNLAGEIKVSTWDRNEVAITGTLGDDVEALEIRGDARNLQVLVRYPRNTRGGVDETLLWLQVPGRAALDLEAVSADVLIDGAGGALSAASVSGDIRATVESSEIKLNTVSGDIQLNAAGARAELQSVSGDIVARGLGDAVKAETVSGDLELDGGPFKSLAAESVSGDLRLLGVRLATGGELRAETLSGEIAVRLGQVPDALVSLQTFSGAVRSDFGTDSASRRELETTLGSGKGRIELNSFSGDVYLGRQ